MVWGVWAARIELQWRGTGLRRGNCEGGEVPKCAGSSGLEWQVSQPEDPRATFAIVGGMYEAGYGRLLAEPSVKNARLGSWRGPRQSTASKTMMPSHACTISAQSADGLFFIILPEALYHLSFVRVKATLSASVDFSFHSAPICAPCDDMTPRESGDAERGLDGLRSRADSRGPKR